LIICLIEGQIATAPTLNPNANDANEGKKKKLKASLFLLTDEK